MKCRVEDGVCVIESSLVTEELVYEHLIEPFAGVPSIQADWAPLAMRNAEAAEVYWAAVRSLRASDAQPQFRARIVRVVPDAAAAELVSRLGAAHRAEGRAEAERLHARAVAEESARLVALAAEVAAVQERAASDAPLEPTDKPRDADPSPPTGEKT